MVTVEESGKFYYCLAHWSLANAQFFKILILNVLSGNTAHFLWNCIGIDADDFELVWKMAWCHQANTWAMLTQICVVTMMTSSNENIFRVTGHLCGEFTGHRALMFSLICVWINGWVNNLEADNLRRYRAHYDVIVMTLCHNATKQDTAQTMCIHLEMYCP